MSTFRLPAEWYPQDAIMFTWPHAETDWQPILHEVEPVYIELVNIITQVQGVVLICHNQLLVSHIKQHLVFLESQQQERITYIVSPCNDTWARDHGPISVVDDKGNVKALDFDFNGWGGKYRYELDNNITKHILKSGITNAQHESMDFVLEGGAIESNGEGILLTTSTCLENSNRNPNHTRSAIEQQLTDSFGIKKTLWLNSGYLAGDDTDSHIDTLARLAPHNTIAYVQCDDEKDEHFHALENMERELKALTNLNGEPFRLIPLPWPKAIYNQDADRLPATYANFLVINGIVLMPTYRDESDRAALDQVQLAFPQHQIMGIDCLPLIKQFGSLHCISMQLPRGFMRTKS